jgi:protein TonB
MTQALVARATTFGASALLMGGLVLLALTMSYTIRDLDLGAPLPPIVVATPEPPSPPPNPTTRQTRPIDPTIGTPELPPITPVTTTEPLRPYVGPVAPSGPVEITSPRWQERPHNLQRYYPPRAIERNIEGEVLLDCLVDAAGLLDCRVVSESPNGWGFAAAAQRIAGAHRMIPATRDGVAVHGRYAMRVPFQIE